MKVSLFILLGATLLSPVAGADVYKYLDTHGQILLTDKPMRGLSLLKRYRIETGRQNVTPAPRAAGSALAAMHKRRDALDPLIQTAAKASQLRPSLVHAVIRAESAYRTDAVSRAGAVGLMQLMPATAERFGVTDRTDPVQNLHGGTTYLSELLEMFDDDLHLALAAYNAGENAVIRYGHKIPPYDETQTYVRRVMDFYRSMDAERKIALR